MICKQCKGTNIEEITPQDLFEDYGLFQDHKFYLCKDCNHDCTDDVEVAQIIYSMEVQLQAIRKDKLAIQNLTPDYFTNTQ